MQVIGTALELSLLIATSATVLVAIVGLGLAWVLARCEFRGKDLVDALITIPLVLPPTVVGYFLMVLLGRDGWIGRPLRLLTGGSLVFTWEGAALAAFTVSLPLMVKVSRAAFEAVDEDLIKVSYSLGKSRRETFFQVVLPIAKGGVGAGLVLSFARSLGEFGATLMVAGNIPGKTSTLSLSIYSAFEAGDDGLANRLALILTLMSVAMVYASTRLNRSRWL